MIATSARRLAAVPAWDNSTPKIWLTTVTSPWPNMMASTADHAAASTVDAATITSRAPFSPNALRNPTNCSMPYFTDGMHGASEISRTLIP